MSSIRRPPTLGPRGAAPGGSYGAASTAAAALATLLGIHAVGCGAGAPPGPSAAAARPAGAPAAPVVAAPAAAPTTAVMQGAVESGQASYYADSLRGRPTASGEPYDPQALTAAHRTLPFGTLVEVSREDGRAVTVRVNDRGPFGKKKRIIDLSRAGAEALGMVRAGVVTVKVRVVGRAAK